MRFCSAPTERGDFRGHEPEFGFVPAKTAAFGTTLRTTEPTSQRSRTPAASSAVSDRTASGDSPAALTSAEPTITASE